MKSMKQKKMKVSLRNLRRDAEAISPIVATLMLVLIAVASASAFYIWESGWQNSQSKQLENANINSGTLVVSGSTTVNDYMNYASPAFMANYTSVKVTIDSIGSGSGLKSLEQGTADIAMISDTINAVQSGATTTYPSLVGTTIAYDGIVMIVSSGAMAAHNLTNANFKMTSTIAQGIYGNASAAPTITNWTQLASAMNGGAVPAGLTNGNDKIAAHYRADSSGTADAFAEKYMVNKGYFATSQFTTWSTASGTTLVGSNGNTGMIADVAADNKAVGFASYGLVSTSGGSVVASTYGADLANQIAPSTTSIKNGVLGVTGGYGAVRPLILVTMGTPSNLAQEFINFCKDPANNVNFCKSTGFVSLYA